MTRPNKHYKLLTVRYPKSEEYPNGVLGWTIEMDPEFIEPIKDELVYIPSKTVPNRTVGEITKTGSEMNFNIRHLADILYQIEKLIRDAGLRATKRRLQ